MTEKIEFLDYEERIISQIHGVKGDGVGLRAKIQHRIILPKKAPNTQQMIVVFYCNDDQLIELRKNGEMVFGDSDFTKSLSRFIRAGTHYMNRSEDVQVVKECRGRLQSLERDITAYKEDYMAVLEEHHARRQDIIRFRNELSIMGNCEQLLRLEESLEQNIGLHREALAVFQRALEEETPSKELLRALWSRLISKLVPNWMLRK